MKRLNLSVIVWYFKCITFAYTFCVSGVGINFKRCLCDENVDCVSMLYFVKLKYRAYRKEEVFEK